MRAAQGHRAGSMNDWRQSVQPRGSNGRLHLAALRRGPPVLLPTGWTISWCIGDRHCCSALLSLPFFLNLVAEDEPPPVIANSFCWYQEVCRATECTGEKKNKTPRDWTRRPKLRILRERVQPLRRRGEELVLRKRSAKLPFLWRRRRRAGRVSRAVCWPWACAWSFYRLLSHTDSPIFPQPTVTIVADALPTAEILSFRWTWVKNWGCFDRDNSKQKAVNKFFKKNPPIGCRQKESRNVPQPIRWEGGLSSVRVAGVTL